MNFEFLVNNLKLYRQFYQTYPQIRQTLTAQLMLPQIRQSVTDELHNIDMQVPPYKLDVKEFW